MRNRRRLGVQIAEGLLPDPFRPPVAHPTPTMTPKPASSASSRKKRAKRTTKRKGA